MNLISPRFTSPRFRRVSSLLMVAATASLSARAQPLTLDTQPRLGSALVATAVPSFMTMPLVAENEAASGVSSSTASLPDAPSAVLRGAFMPLDGAVKQPMSDHPVAPIHTKYIPSGWVAQPITAKDKIVLGLEDLYSPLNFAGMIVDAGYSHVLNGEPNYGVDKGAFGERLGAAGIRESTQGIFTDAVFAPLLHQDPRYYVEGSQYGFFHRVIYAGTRPILTRNDSGKSAINASLLLGYASSSALTYTYYPQINKNFHDTASTFGGAIGGAALGYLVSEFSDDLLKFVHMKK